MFSRYKKWITVTPKHKDRRHPLENEKISNTKTSRIMPSWMLANHPSNVKQPECFKAVEYYPIRQKVYII